MALSDDDILNIIGNELKQTSGGGNNGDTIGAVQRKGLSYYHGNVDAQPEEGYSQVVSTDIADAVEWILPEVVKSLTRSHDIVKFDAVGEDDEDQADLESQFVYDLIMKENNGFVLFSTLVKDALIQKNCTYKVFYDEDKDVSTESYTGINQQAYAAIMANPEAEIVAEEFRLDEMGQQVADVTIAITRDKSTIRVIAIPPEEFRINSQHRGINVKEARFSAHVSLKTASELAESGVPSEVIAELPRGKLMDDDRDHRFIIEGETVYPDGFTSNDPSQEVIEVAECYLSIDVNEDGIAELMQITVAGGDNPDAVLDLAEIDECEHALGGGTGILMPHKFYGLSIYDRLKSIQDQKTALLRNTLDNLYLQNNKQLTAVEGRVNIESMLTSDPFGILIQDEPGMIGTLDVQPIGQEAFQMMEYLDNVRAGRVGVDPGSNVADQFIGLQGGDQSVERIMTAKEELVGMITRTIAETVVKPMMYQVRDLARKHQNTPKNYKFRGRWQAIDPTRWIERKQATVDVGTGSGNTKEQQAAMQMVLSLQEKIFEKPGQALVREEEVYSAIQTIGRMSGLKGVTRYFIDPQSDEGKAHRQKLSEQSQEAKQKDEEMQAITLDAQQRIAKAEQGKVVVMAKNAELTNEVNQYKAQVDEGDKAAKAAGKDDETRLAWAKLELERDKLELERQKLQQQEALEITRLEIENDTEASAQHAENKEGTE